MFETWNHLVKEDHKLHPKVEREFYMGQSEAVQVQVCLKMNVFLPSITEYQWTYQPILTEQILHSCNS